ncbi:MAG: hypothetical protein COU35_02610 [Candidatus Magasanikbacteria bacterium CG10_big_fil_rev_8_21_14_0_10_47_10]|uniref:Clp R domain-containing protein n=1 Tax=Candidatus Magasanikbacteria bacterium CG10_big_fil_rev_8_21_14_0_10_47_10 TaxID=1974652 RepID=A0A2H0TQN2_9BACT|nr:MAG: hypothetical protein COU35_02610 [Candidatus Magasanikbacteria bacterium CG10_big_fil_rev_8_21_14_0_10_47_10]
MAINRPPPMNANHILDNLSSHLKNSIANAISLATSLTHKHVQPLHLLFALSKEKGSLAAEILSTLHCNVDMLEKTVIEMPRIPDEKNIAQTQGQPVTTLLPDLDERARTALEKAMLLAYEHGHKYIGTEHLLYGLMQISDPLISATLKQDNISKKKVMKHIDGIISTTSRFPDMEDVMDVIDELESQHPDGHSHQASVPRGQNKKKIRRQQTALEVFAVELTDLQIQKNIDPVIGREMEIERLMHILCRRTKNNPVLIGEPGVGKTAIVEGFAKRVVEKKVPDALKHKKIYSVDMALLISGTVYRGEFEARLKQLIDEVAAMPDCIVFIDELHNIIGAGANQGSLDAANMLKPALARGQLRCIGATTMDEYHKYIASDPALERRFQPIFVKEPSADQTIHILKGLKKQYEQYHNVTIDADALEHAVHLSGTYVHTNFFPDKALDLLDEAASSVRVRTPVSKAQTHVAELTQKLRTMQGEKEAAIMDEAFDKAMQIKKQEEQMAKKIAAFQKKAHLEKKSIRARVTKRDIARVLARTLLIDEKELLLNSWQRLDAVGLHLRKNIFGQDAVIAKIVNALKSRQLRAREHGPYLSMLLVGPSGVGKTSLAKELAHALYRDRDALIQFDMSEFSEGHSVSKLLGSPAGYVGHKERNRFTEQLKKNPHSIILFDEIDKAHPDVTRLLLQMLEQGTLTDSAGKRISFAHSIIILTSNAGAELYSSAGIGFGEKTTAALCADRNTALTQLLKEQLDSSLLGRLDEICMYEPLDDAAMIRLMKQKMKRISDDLEKTNNVRILFNPTILAKLAQKAYNKDTGARHAEHVIEDIVHSLVLEFLQKRPLSKKTTVTLQESNGSYEIV